MSERARRPDIFERLGSAVNSSCLEMRSTHETQLERVAALGAASNRVATGADLAGLPVAAMAEEVYRRSVDMRTLMLDPGGQAERDVLASEIGPNLVHLREGDQRQLLPATIKLYARWLRHRRLFADFRTTEELALLERFAGCVLHEWLSDRCRSCGGTGRLERTASGAYIRPRGSMQRNATYGPCDACKATGRARPSQQLRVRLLGMTHQIYEADNWKQRFNAALIWLSHLLHDRIKRPLTAELERGTKRS